jgi:biotin carboxyl carrier protein
MRKYEFTLNDKRYEVIADKVSPTEAELRINGTLYVVRIESTGNAEIAAPVLMTEPIVLSSPQVTDASAVLETVRAPIPGSLLTILVKEGDIVKEGQPLLVMEAMKMENEILATVDGTVRAIHVGVSDAVEQDQCLIDIG